MNHRKPRLAPDHRAAKHRQLARSDDVMDLQVIGKDQIAGEIGDHGKAAGRDHRGNDRQPVEAIGQVDRVRGSDDHKCAKRHKEPAERKQQVLEERNCQSVRQPRRRYIGNGDAGSGGEHEFEGELGSAGEAAMRIPGQLAIIVEEADQPESGGGQQHDPHIRIGQIRPQQGRCRQRDQDQETAHRRRSLLAQQMPIGTVRANRLAVRLLPPQPQDQVRTENKADQQRGDDRPSRAEGDVAEQVEELELVRERIKQRVQHRFTSLAGLDSGRPIARATAPRRG